MNWNASVRQGKTLGTPKTCPGEQGTLTTAKNLHWIQATEKFAGITFTSLNPYASSPSYIFSDLTQRRAGSPVDVSRVSVKFMAMCHPVFSEDPTWCSHRNSGK